MKKTVAVLLCFSCVLFTVCGCSFNGGSGTTPPTTMSFSEKASYYDELAADDRSIIPLTTSRGAKYEFDGDVNLLLPEVYEALCNILTSVYPKVGSMFGASYVPMVSIALDPTYNRDDAYYVVGESIVINVEWFQNNPDEVDVIIQAFADMFMDYPDNDAPEWLESSISCYIRDSYGIYREKSDWSLPKRYEGGSYTDGNETGAAFLKWIYKNQHIDIVARLNSEMKKATEFSSKFWVDATGKTLDQLWMAYKEA